MRSLVALIPTLIMLCFAALIVALVSTFDESIYKVVTVGTVAEAMARAPRLSCA